VARDWRIWSWMVRSVSVVEEEEAEERDFSAACTSPNLSKRRVLRIRILPSSSPFPVVAAKDKVSKCRLAVSNSPISINSPATLRPKSLNLDFQVAKPASSFSDFAFAAKVRHSVLKAYNPMIVLRCTSGPNPWSLSNKSRNDHGTCERKTSREGRG
jgi:hypothetical protein